MDKKEIEKKVKEILANQLNIDTQKIKMDSHLGDDLGIDSFAMIEVMFAFEETFGVQIKEESVKDIVKVTDIITYIEQQLGSCNPT